MKEIKWNTYCEKVRKVSEEKELGVQTYIWLIEELPKLGLLEKLGIKIIYK